MSATTKAVCAHTRGKRPDTDSPELRARTWSRLQWVLGVATLAVVVLAARHFAEAEQYARLVARAEPWWLALAVVFQSGTYLAQGQVFRCVARSGRFPLSLATACRVGFIKLYVDQAVPSGGLSGTIALDRALRQQGMPRALIASGIVIDLASYYAAYAFCLVLALALSAARGDTRSEERRVGKECSELCRSRWSPYH